MNDKPSTGKLVAWGVAIVTGFIVLNLVAALLGAGFTIFGAKLKAETDKATLRDREISQTHQPANSIANYESFYNDCTSIVALNEQIVSAKTELDQRVKAYDAVAKANDSFGNEAKSINTMRTQISSLEAQRSQVAQSYNARSSQATRAEFKAAELPPSINAPYTSVQCGTAKEGTR